MARNLNATVHLQARPSSRWDKNDRWCWRTMTTTCKAMPRGTRKSHPCSTPQAACPRSSRIQAISSKVELSLAQRLSATRPPFWTGSLAPISANEAVPWTIAPTMICVGDIFKMRFRQSVRNYSVVSVSVMQEMWPVWSFSFTTTKFII